MAIVYRHIRLDKNEPFYIGIGRDEARAFSKKGRNRHWRFITTKSNYEIDILFEDLSWEQACEKEREFIALYGRKDLSKGTLVNMTDGGDGGDTSMYIDYKKLNENKDHGKATLHPNYIATRTNKNLTSLKVKLKAQANRKAVGYEYSTKKMRAGLTKIQCPYCLKEGDIGNMTRWHFKNCKHVT
jgi:stress response protein SCP2